MQPCVVGAEVGLAQAIEGGAPGYTRYMATRLRETVSLSRYYFARIASTSTDDVVAGVERAAGTA